MASIYLLENHLMLRQITSKVINKLEDISICGVAGSGQEALKQVPLRQADLVVADLALPDMNGVDFVQELCLLLPNLPTLTLSSYQEAYYVQRALAAGARGYVVKGYPLEIEKGIHRVLASEIYLCPRCRHEQLSPFLP